MTVHWNGDYSSYYVCGADHKILFSGTRAQCWAFVRKGETK